MSQIAAKGFNAEEGHRLHLVFVRAVTAKNVQWLAAHAPADATYVDVMTHGLPVFRSHSGIFDVEKPHPWDWWDEQTCRWQPLGTFDTNIMP